MKQLEVPDFLLSMGEAKKGSWLHCSVMLKSTLSFTYVESSQVWQHTCFSLNGY